VAGDAVAGAYGLRVAGLEPTEWLAVEGAGDWPELRFELDGAATEVDPARMRATVAAGTPLAEVVHPTLARLGWQLALSRGRDALHAGALLGAAGAWGVVGTKEAGKSTLLGACARAGLDVMSDDALFLDGGSCFAGPRCIDLRPGRADLLEGTTPVRPATPRHRLTLAPVVGEAPLAGLLFLEWGEAPELERLGPSAATERLLQRRASDRLPRDPEVLMGLAGLPAYLLRRSRSWDELDATVELVRRLLERPA
jgi:hypothetical protein